MFAGLDLAAAVARFAPADCCFAAVAPFGSDAARTQATERGLLVTGADGRPQALFPALVDGEPPRSGRRSARPDRRRFSPRRRATI